MKLKTHEYCIEISYNYRTHAEYRTKTCFIIKGVPLTIETAQKIAEILFPDFFDIKVESITNDVLTLSCEEYYDIKTVLKEYVRIHDKINEPEYVADVRKSNVSKIENIIDKMEHRIDQFPFKST